jgi:hypothetical protein
MEIATRSKREVVRDNKRGGHLSGLIPVGLEAVAVEPVAVEPVAVEPVAVEPVAVETASGDLASWSAETSIAVLPIFVTRRGVHKVLQDPR